MGWDNELGLTKGERELIEDFRKLSEDEREIAKNYIHAITQISQMRDGGTLEPSRKKSG
jgi:hypothetical protein